MTPAPIFIIGCDRSGTTLLRLMLIQSSILHIPQESMFVNLLQKDPEIYGDFTQAYQRWFLIRDLQTNPATPESFTFPIFNLTLEQAETALAQAAPTNIAGAISTLFITSAQTIGKQRWGDKTPRHVKHISRLASAFPDAHLPLSASLQRRRGPRWP
ncbi:MAG: sulfotransferase [Cyanobacteriota bacterium]|nr:sulfotransferase [Cyanobacteriota bacterium]